MRYIATVLGVLTGMLGLVLAATWWVDAFGYFGRYWRSLHGPRFVNRYANPSNPNHANDRPLFKFALHRPWLNPTQQCIEHVHQNKSCSRFSGQSFYAYCDIWSMKIARNALLNFFKEEFNV